MSTQVYRGFTLNNEDNDPWVTVELTLLKAMIDKLPAYADTLVTTEHTHAKLVHPTTESDYLYISSGSGYFGFNETNPITFFELTHSDPYITLHNSSSENNDGGRESRIISRGHKLDDTEHELGRMEISHNGSGNDFYGMLRVFLNDEASSREILKFTSVGNASGYTTFQFKRPSLSLSSDQQTAYGCQATEFMRFTNSHPANGAFLLRSFANTSVGANIEAYVEGDPSGVNAGLSVKVFKHNAGALTTVGDTGELFNVRNNTTDRLKLFGNGDLKLFNGDLFTTAWTDYSSTSTVVGWSSFTNKYIFYKIIGKWCWVIWRIAGTSDATTASFTLPVTTKNVVGNDLYGQLGRCIDNGTGIAGGFFLLANDDTIFCTTNTGSPLTASGTKDVRGSALFEIA